MWNKLKKNQIVWMIFRIVSREYQPPFGSVGHAIQSGKITRKEAAAYLDKTAIEQGRPLHHTEIGPKEYDDDNL